MTEVTEVTFEEGYRRLQEIAERVNAQEVPVQEMCDLFAEGKGLDKALSAFLAEQKTRVERIEAGEEIQAFKIVAPSAGAGDSSEDIPFAADDFAPAPAVSAPRVSDDDIPF
jgi:exodeoxyribonuclease VII small subunit